MTDEAQMREAQMREARMREARMREARMREALELARRGRGRVEPNPRVGALALCDETVVGRGFHAAYGGDHAEVVALREAAAAGAAPDTLVVTLEPCSSPLGVAGKKTPPCTEAILAAGVRRVVIGAPDPDPRHLDRGSATLRAAGVEVVTGVLAGECRAENRLFDRWLAMDVPWVVAKWAMSLDGKTATRSGDSRWISGEESRARVHAIRGEVDAVMVGFRTAVVDDPRLTVRQAERADPQRSASQAAGAAPQRSAWQAERAAPVRVVVDPRAELPLDKKLVQTARAVPTWILAGPDADAERVSRLRGQGVVVVEVGEVVEVGAEGRDLDLAAGLRELRKLGLCRVLMEGGGGLATRLFEANLVQQVMVFVAPKVVGGSAAKTPVGGLGVDALADAWRVDEVFHEGIGADVVVHGFVVPGPG